MNKLLFTIVLLSFFACGDKKIEHQANIVDIKSRLININQYLNDKDKDVIEHYIRRHNWNMEFSDNGFYYEILERGEAPLINTGTQVMYAYRISQLDGTLCYTSDNSEEKIFTVGSSDEISGMHLAAKLLGKGGKARFIFPSQLAHGLIGDRNKIPALATLVYYVEIIDVGQYE